MADREWVLGDKRRADTQDFSQTIALRDHKIAFMVKHARGKRVLDLGCVQHNPENYRSKYWLHGALVSVASHIEGLDIYADGVAYLCDRGYRISVGNAQNFRLGREFDVIVAGDIVEHLENFEGFFNCCKAHLVPGGDLGLHAQPLVLEKHRKGVPPQQGVHQSGAYLLALSADPAAVGRPPRHAGCGSDLWLPLPPRPPHAAPAGESATPASTLS